jgi:hypothetical protein
MTLYAYGSPSPFKVKLGRAKKIKGTVYDFLHPSSLCAVTKSFGEGP